MSAPDTTRLLAQLRTLLDLTSTEIQSPKPASFRLAPRRYAAN